jgi:hypothetical protein
MEKEGRGRRKENGDIRANKLHWDEVLAGNQQQMCLHKGSPD